jgi:ribosomal protein S17E
MKIRESEIRRITKSVIRDFIMESSNNDIENGINPYSDELDDDYFDYQKEIVSEMYGYDDFSKHFKHGIGGLLAKKRTDQVEVTREELFWEAEGILMNTLRLDKDGTYKRNSNSFNPTPHDVEYACEIVKKYATDEEKEKLIGLYKDSEGNLHRVK